MRRSSISQNGVPTAELPTGIRIRGSMCHMRIKRPGRGWEWEATELPSTQLAAAAKLRRATQALIDAGEPTRGPAGRGTVAAYAERWLRGRRQRKLKSVDDDETRLELHVLACRMATGVTFGELALDEVRPVHCRAVVRWAVSKGLASRTVRNVASVAGSMFAEAVVDEELQATPWLVPKHELPKKRDSDPAWRARAKFSLEEIRLLLWAKDELVPWDRRIYYALCYFGALRVGEASSRRWHDFIEAVKRPAMHIHNQYSTERGREDETKTDSVRMMPLHPQLGELLEAWHDHGWREIYGREPKAGDLIVPSRLGRCRSSNHMLKKFYQDLDGLGMRRRRLHDLRRSFIGHAVDAGASRDRLKPATHGLGTSVIELYDSPEWVACVEQVLKLEISPQAATAMGRQATGGGSVGTPWGRGAKTAPKGTQGAKNWRGGRDSKSQDLTRSVTTGPRNSGYLGGPERGRPVYLRSVDGLGVPILPMAEARALLAACGGDVELAVETLRAANEV